MKNFTGLLSLALLLVLASCQKKDQLNTLTKKEMKQGWELLFDGKSLDNWKTFNGGAVAGWKIEEGILYNSGGGSDHGGDIITKKEFGNFELYLEWKVDSQSNSGVFYHVQEGLTNAIYETGPEYQLIDEKGWPDKLEDWQKSGANYAMNPPQDSEVKPVGEWNITRIIANGTHVEHWLNGTKVVEYELWSPDWEARKAAGKWADSPEYGMAKSGHIGLQDHGGLSVFRNIKIREINE